MRGLRDVDVACKMMLAQSTGTCARHHCNADIFAYTLTNISAKRGVKLFAMRSEPCLSKLQDAVEDERTQAVCTPEYRALVSKMVKYSEDKGLAPTIEDFIEWRNSVDRTKYERSSGFAELD